MNNDETTEHTTLKRLLEPSPQLPTEYKRYLIFSNYGAIVACFLHWMFCLLFMVVEVYPLAIFNIGSSLFYLVCLYLNRKRLLGLNLVLVTCEVVTHALLCMFYLGWDSGFHYYILAMSMVIFFTPWRANVRKVSAVLFLSIFYITLKHYSANLAPIAGLDEWVITLFDWGNVLGFVLLLSIFAYYYNDVATEAQEALAREHERSEELLHNILPVAIANRLKNKAETIADAYPESTTLFSDLVGFTVLSGEVSPQKLVKILNYIFTEFDNLAEKHGIEKIKTIGDAYMVAAGLTDERKNHTETIADMALDMMEAMRKVNRRLGSNLNVRIGINSGPVVAGVIGRKKFAYDLWGDSVNTAARMESHGIPGEIQVSQAAYERIKDRFVFEDRGEIEVKGKGRMRTYLLKSRKNTARPDGHGSEAATA